MSPKTFPVLAAVCIIALASFAAAADSDASPSGTYKDQLDADGQALYSYMEARFAELEESPAASASFSYTLKTPMVLASEDDAGSEAEALVEDVLTAYYMTDPSPIWLWNLPVQDAPKVDYTTDTAEIRGDADTEETGKSVYPVLISVSFTLSAPSEFSDKTAISEAVSAVRSALVSVDGDSDKDKVEAINDLLRGTDPVEDADGAISTIYDALVSGASSSAGVAAAFTAMCLANGITAMTVNGSVMSSTEEDASAGWWNYVRIDGVWYAADSTFNSSDSRNCLLAGNTTKIEIDGGSVRYLSTHAPDVGIWSGSSLSAPALSSEGWDWPEAEQSLLDAYGTYIFGAIIAVIIIAVLIHAVRAGDA